MKLPKVTPEYLKGSLHTHTFYYSERKGAVPVRVCRRVLSFGIVPVVIFLSSLQFQGFLSREGPLDDLQTDEWIHLNVQRYDVTPR